MASKFDLSRCLIPLGPYLGGCGSSSLAVNPITRSLGGRYSSFGGIHSASFFSAVDHQSYRYSSPWSMASLRWQPLGIYVFRLL
jgi:hypothetical protein